MKIHPRQGPILLILKRCKGLSQADLVRMMKVSAATIAVSISRLEKMELVKRKRNELNQRANILALTEAGESVAQQMETNFKTVGKAAIKNIDEKDIELMGLLCSRMIDNMQSSFQHEEVKADICIKYSNT